MPTHEEPETGNDIDPFMCHEPLASGIGQKDSNRMEMDDTIDLSGGYNLDDVISYIYLWHPQTGILQVHIAIIYWPVKGKYLTMILNTKTQSNNIHHLFPH